MVEIASAAQGPLQDLNQAIEDLVEEIHTNIAELESDFKDFTNTFFRDSTRLDQQAQDAQIDVSQAQDNLDNFLEPSLEHVSSQLVRLGEYMTDNRNTLATETVLREKAHADFEERVNQHQLAIDAVDECLNTLQGIQNAGSLAQIKKLQSSVEVIEASIGRREVLAPLVINIMELTTTQNFADQSVLKTVQN